MRRSHLLFSFLLSFPHLGMAGSCPQWSTPDALDLEIQRGREAYFLVDSPGALEILQAAEVSLPCIAGQIPMETLGSLYMSLGAVLLDVGEDDAAESALARGAWAANALPWDPSLEAKAKSIYESQLRRRQDAPVTEVASGEDLLRIDGITLAPGETLSLPVGEHYLQQELEAGLWIGGWIELAQADRPCVFSLGAMPGQWICMPIEVERPEPITLDDTLASTAAIDLQKLRRRSALFGATTLGGAALWGSLNYAFFISNTIQRTDPNYTRTALFYYGVSAGVLAGGVGTAINLRRLRVASKPTLQGDVALLVTPATLQLRWSW